MKKTINDLGKYGLVDHIISGFTPGNKTTVISPGDDSAAIAAGNELVLFSADLMLEGIHFNLIYTPLKHLGYKSVIRAISDIYAMNGKPGQILISLGISSRFTLEDIDEFYNGVKLACLKYDVDLAGGDTTSSLTGLTIGLTALGTVSENRVVKRSGAKPNDLVCVTGDLGASYMGLQLLERERRLFESNRDLKPVLEGHEYIIGRQLKPEFPSDIPDLLEKNGITPTSMTDITEGLASDLLQLCKSSDTGCRIYRDKIPVAEETGAMAEEFGIDPLVPVLNGGEDYELLFTVPLDQFERLSRLGRIKIIGHITQNDYGRFIVSGNGEEAELTAQGWRS
ncbi:MAG TPA: thiamine-phosphate kinase [Bacteroidales bacterium]|nr:thiamine-phosphate kinase [Bacteroidales bacterium]